MQDSPKNFHKKFLGDIGEKQAVKHLKTQGYKIVKKNFKTRIGEIDVIAQDGEEIVFIEVKTRSNLNFGAPSLAVDQKKQAKYFKVAQEYLIKYKKTQSQCRFDVIEVLNGEINHIKHAFSM